MTITLWIVPSTTGWGSDTHADGVFLTTGSLAFGDPVSRWTASIDGQVETAISLVADGSALQNARSVPRTSSYLVRQTTAYPHRIRAS